MCLHLLVFAFLVLDVSKTAGMGEALSVESSVDSGFDSGIGILSVFFVGNYIKINLLK